MAGLSCKLLISRFDAHLCLALLKILGGKLPRKSSGSSSGTRCSRGAGCMGGWSDWARCASGAPWYQVVRLIWQPCLLCDNFLIISKWLRPLIALHLLANAAAIAIGIVRASALLRGHILYEHVTITTISCKIHRLTAQVHDIKASILWCCEKKVEITDQGIWLLPNSPAAWHDQALSFLSEKNLLIFCF